MQFFHLGPTAIIQRLPLLNLGFECSLLLLKFAVQSFLLTKNRLGVLEAQRQPIDVCASRRELGLQRSMFSANVGGLFLKKEINMHAYEGSVEPPTSASSLAFSASRNRAAFSFNSRMPLASFSLISATRTTFPFAAPLNSSFNRSASSSISFS